MSGGIENGDTALVFAVFNNELISGGIESGDTALVFAVFNTDMSASGLLANGSAIVSCEINFASSSGIEIGGEAIVIERMVYRSDGGPILTGGASSFVLRLYFEQQINWNVNQNIFVDQNFSWVTGLPPFRWWRVQGSCNYPTAAGSGLPTGDQFPGGLDVMGIETDDVKCVGAIGKQQFIQQILARTASEVCEELRKSKLDWQIVGMKRWSRPADPSVVQAQEQAGIADYGNKLEDVPYQTLPACIEFTFQTKAITHIRATTILIDSLYFYAGSGTIRTSGAADTDILSGGTTPTVASFNYVSNGQIIETGGSAIVISSVDVDHITEMLVTTTIEENVVFTIQDNLPSIIPPSNSTATGCATCGAMPLQIFLQNNLNNPSILYNFLQRNGYTFPNIITMNYNARLETWVSQLHYAGISDNESWRFSFEMGCVTEYGAESTGTPAIKFAISIMKKNIDTNTDYDTRIIVLFPSIEFCSTINNFLEDFPFSIDIKAFFVNAPNSIAPITVLVYDKIGIFSSTYWASNPNLNLRLSSTSSSTIEEKLDITSFLPKQNTLIAQGLNIAEAAIQLE